MHPTHTRRQSLGLRKHSQDCTDAGQSEARRHGPPGAKRQLQPELPKYLKVSESKKYPHAPPEAD